MRKKVEPRFPEENQKLRRTVLAFGDDRRLAGESGVTLATITRIAQGKSRFPWAQTVRAIEQALKRLQPTPVVTSWAPSTQSRKIQPARSHRKRNDRPTALELRLRRRLKHRR